MEDTYITFETAKLAKEKGFNERGHWFYKVKSENDVELYGCKKKELVGFKGYKPIYYKVNDYHTNKEKLNAKLYRCSAPTQSLLAKWLREKHEIYVTPRESYAFDQTLEFVCSVNNIFVNHGNNDEPINRFKIYEDAYEKGLQEALKLI